MPKPWSRSCGFIGATCAADASEITPLYLYAICVDLNSGAIVHDIEVFRPDEIQKSHATNSYASPSAVLEEGRVYVHFGSYGTACLDSKTGEELWRRTDLKRSARGRLLFTPEQAERIRADVLERIRKKRPPRM